MKVCYIVHNNNLTGANRSLLDMLYALRNSEVEPVVLIPKHGPLEEELRTLEIPYRILPYVTAVKGPFWIKNLLKRCINVISPFWIAVLFKKERIELIHNNSFLVSTGMAAAYCLKIPYISHLRELVQEDHQLYFLNEKKQLKLLGHADICIAISNYVYKKYSKLAPEQNFLTIYDGMDISNYLIEHHKILTHTHINIMIAGRIAPGKGQMEAVKAAKVLRERGISSFTLKIVGDPGDVDYYKQLVEYVEANSVNQVEFVPFINSTSELCALRAESDINLVCSRAEAMGRVTIESQLAGCLTIGANAGATQELIQDGKTGLFYEVGNSSDLSDKIIYAAEHPNEMRQIAICGQRYAQETYNSFHYREKLLDLYRTILQKHPNKSI